MKLFLRIAKHGWLAVIFLSFSSISYAAFSKELFNAVAEIYIYAFPAVLTNLSKQVMTNVPTAQANGRAPINQFSHAKGFATPESKDVVRPNNDTFYSIAWLDLVKEPLILSVPDTHDRYYVMPLIDAWTEVFDSIGKRTTGTAPRNFLIAGPEWQGIPPANMTMIKSTTNTVWITGRTLVMGQNDVPDVQMIQQGYKLTPLSQWGTNYYPPTNLPIDPTIDLTTTPLDQLKKMDAKTFFGLFAKILKTNPPHAIDTEILDKLNMIGIIPGKDFDAAKLTTAETLEYERAMLHGLHEIELQVRKLGEANNGWHTPSVVGRYGVAYINRAAVAFIGLGANIPEDSVYPSAFEDQRNNKLNGSYHYKIHFNANEIPPANGFWSVTLYGADNYLVANPLNRHALGDRSSMKFNNDGSLDMYIQNDSPGKNKEANWLPAPQGDFNLTLRLYWPKPQVLNGEWHPPAVQLRRL